MSRPLELPHGSAVRLDDNTYAVFLSAGQYVIGGTTTVQFYSTTKVVVSKENLNRIMAQTGSPNSEFWLLKDGQVVSKTDVDSFSAQRNALSAMLLAGGVDEATENAVLARMSAISDLLQTMTKVQSSDDTTFTPVNVTVVGDMADTGSAFIENSLHVGRTDSDPTERTRQIGVFIVKTPAIINDVFRQMAKEFPDEQIKVDANYPKFTNINGTYVVGTEPIVRTFAKLDDAVAFEKETRRHYRGLGMAAIKRAPAGMIMSPQMINEMHRIQRVIAGLDIKVAGKVQHRDVVRQLNRLITLIEKSVVADALGEPLPNQDMTDSQ